MNGRAPDRPGWGPEDGSTFLVLPLLVWVVTLATIASVDVVAYLVAAQRAQSLADAAALAAVTADADPLRPGSPRGRATAVIAAGNGRLEACRCDGGAGHADLEVSVDVTGLVLPRLGAARVTAHAEATLVPARTDP